ncbi:MAG TPA: hypothetical protein VFB72_09275 [Verrucomicrobiae bacterium]|nr:hypothetical protein [Verrucomicrobiae bacterium]
MKRTIIALIALGLCASTFADSLVTTDGTRYDNITSKRVDPDGLFIEYSLADGGIGMAKVKFTKLSADEQKQYGYDAAKAREYETAVAKANDDWRTNAEKMETEARTLRAQQDADAAQEESVKTQRILALAQLKQAEAELARANGGAGFGGYDEGGWGGGLFAIPGIGPGHAKTTFAPVVTPVPWPQINSSLMNAPMNARVNAPQRSSSRPARSSNR